MARERDVLEVDVLFVGAGPASLGGAIRLAQLYGAHNDAVRTGQKTGPELSTENILVIDKARNVGDHGISGAVLDPTSMRELFGDFIAAGCPVESPVTSDSLWFLSKTSHLKAPIAPPPMNNRGKYVASLNKLVKWLAAQAESLGVQVFPESPGQQVLYDGERVIGVRMGDKGLDKNGVPKANYEPGPDILAKVTVLGEGPRGTLAKQLEKRFELSAGKNAQVYSIGIKELWQMPKGTVPAGQVIHTLGFPLDRDTFGGGFIYSMADDIWDVGFVVGLDYKNPMLEPHAEFQRFKMHPSVAALLAGGQMIRYGAKAIPEGGWFSMPRPFGEGFLLIGDSAGMLNPLKLKGIHLGMKSGMLAAETCYDAVAASDSSALRLSAYQERIDRSWIRRDLYSARNFHQAFDRGRIAGIVNTALGFITGGRAFGVVDKLSGKPGQERMERLVDYFGRDVPGFERPRYDNKLTFSKLDDVFRSGTKHDENAPNHLHVLDTDICASRCAHEFGNPCQYFCPANVYEMVPAAIGSHSIEKEGFSDSGKRLQINFANCVHCKTCDIMDPYQIIDWVPPEGGGGPVYTGL
ncbi:MAG: electron transfer flavoprotein-ubiquinone oxidoreductase [Candidatus Eremiobacter antarcticus]|nr:electron transfer flavoprotein-ubiquinone oxidoreductase [Candidatus Eremiobacteraeota bacterium]MBC5807080.1 electron transfer flavoprotein-ubiquinone oxidoreductase [Candidatus Eremiobacteraeota bacterium]PZR62795.1 MAG: electron transfer flavoprotein-ubiquinone oxidoreductase [Candidatus Eremiobacter sp. RRmetagenome_bin22]